MGLGECLLKHNKRENNTERPREKGQLTGFDPVTLCSSCCGDYDPPRLKLNTVFCFSRFRGVPGRFPISHRDQVCAHTAWSLFLFGDKTHRELFKLSCLTLIYYIVTSDTLISHDKQPLGTANAHVCKHTHATHVSSGLMGREGKVRPASSAWLEFERVKSNFQGMEGGRH